MKTLIIYDSVFGNTAEIAKAIANATPDKDSVSVISAKDFSIEHISDIELLIVGSPTRGFRPTKPILDLLNNLPAEKIRNIRVAAFDTRIDLETIKNRFLKFLVDNKYAAKPIARALIKKGGKLIVEPEGFLVTGEQGPIKKGEIERAFEWGRKLFYFQL